MDAGISFSDLLAYNAHERDHWKRWFREHPEALDLPCDLANSDSVRRFVLHIVSTDLVFANGITCGTPIDWNSLSSDTLDGLFAIGEQAQCEMEQFLASATESDLDEVRPFGFRGYEATRRDMITQALLHAVQHRAQLATFLRQHGYKDQWVHDYIATRCK